MDRILTISDVCAMTPLTEATLRWYRHVGRGPRSFKLGRRVVYRESDVRKWIDQQYANDSARRVGMAGE